jgi:glucose/arabinose dehydrogenase
MTAQMGLTRIGLFLPQTLDTIGTMITRVTHGKVTPRWRTAVHSLAFLLSPVLALPVAEAGTEALAYEEQTLKLDGARQVARVPKGYRLELLAEKLEGPRLLTFADNKDLFIGSKSGMIYRVPPPYNLPEVLVRLDDYPHSVAFRRGEILIARTNGLYRAPYQSGQKSIAPESVALLARLPGGSGHSSRTVGVGPDGRVYVSLGIQGNCSNQYLGDRYPFDKRRGGVFVLREDDGQPRWEAFGSGLRNPVGFAWHPGTKIMYASNNGPDHLGYDQPPEYFSRVTAGSFHGMPWFQFDGKQVKRDNCASSRPPRPLAEVAVPVATFPSRNAPMGVAFVPAGALGKTLEHDAIVALRGSWGTQPSGGFIGSAATRRPPKLVAVRFKDGEAVRVDDLVTGFQLADGGRWARPVGVAVGPDGALYFTSDSETNGLFRLRRK